MQRSCLTDEVIYYSNIPSEIEIAKMILAYLKIEYKGGISSNGPTIHLSYSDNARFEKEAGQWKEAVTEVCSSFIK